MAKRGAHLNVRHDHIIAFDELVITRSDNSYLPQAPSRDIPHGRQSWDPALIIYVGFRFQKLFEGYHLLRNNSVMLKLLVKRPVTLP